ncbi:hypothetical protein DF043_03645 [Burkholderia cepacia]|nr:hypothetical protein DF043_03645 [Burkholderia cepacia]
MKSKSAAMQIYLITTVSLFIFYTPSSASERFPYDTECMVVSEDIIREGTRQLSWRITMRADTEVMLDYCYRPDARNQPSLVLLPQREPLVFTRGTWFTDPIDDELIAPVKDPE